MPQVLQELVAMVPHATNEWQRESGLGVASDRVLLIIILSRQPVNVQVRPMPEPDPPCEKTRKSPPRFGMQSSEASRTGQWIPTESVALPSGSPTRMGKFELRGTLGQGAFGLVYRGYDPELHRDVAIKVPHGAGMLPDLRERFLREARAAAKIHHPNVCPVYDVGTEGDIPYIVMHFVPGPTLAGVLKQRQTPFPTRHAAAIVRKLALGVAAAHAQGVIHRDLKPANVLVNDVSREVLITDFGLARFSSETPLSVQGDVLGTPAYMSPEQGRGDVDAIGPPSDIYSLGVILYHLVTGTVPFRGTILELMVQLERATPKLPSVVHPGIDPAIDAICLKALAKAPGDRFGSAKEFANALADFLRGISPSEELVPHAETVVPAGAIPMPAPPPATGDEFDHLGNGALATFANSNEASVRDEKPRRSSKRSKPRKRTEKSSGYRPVVLLALLIVVLIGGLFGGVRLLRPSKKPEEQTNNEAKKPATPIVLTKDDDKAAKDLAAAQKRERELADALAVKQQADLEAERKRLEDAKKDKVVLSVKEYFRGGSFEVLHYQGQKGTLEFTALTEEGDGFKVGGKFDHLWSKQGGTFTGTISKLGEVKLLLTYSDLKGKSVEFEVTMRFPVEAGNINVKSLGEGNLCWSFDRDGKGLKNGIVPVERRSPHPYVLKKK